MWSSQSEADSFSATISKLQLIMHNMTLSLFVTTTSTVEPLYYKDL